MAVLYANKIKREAGKQNAFTIDNVPHLWYQQTIDLLYSQGFDGYGFPL